LNDQVRAKEQAIGVPIASLSTTAACAPGAHSTFFFFFFL